MLIKDEYLCHTVVMIVPKLFDFFHESKCER